MTAFFNGLRMRMRSSLPLKSVGKRKRLRLLTLEVVAVLSLLGCGGGDPEEESTVPPPTNHCQQAPNKCR